MSERRFFLHDIQYLKNQFKKRKCDLCKEIIKDDYLVLTLRDVFRGHPSYTNYHKTCFLKAAILTFPEVYLNDIPKRKLAEECKKILLEHAIKEV